MTDGKTVCVNVRLSEADKAALVRRMESAGGGNLSEYVRGIVRRHLKRSKR